MTSTPWVVLKFGGTSVASAERWHTIARVTRQHLDAGRRPLIVCSALARISDRLVQLGEDALAGRHAEALAWIRERHEALARELGIPLPSPLLEELDHLGQLAQGVFLVQELSPRAQARMLAAGELMSTRLGAAFLHQDGLSTAWLDARELLQAADPEDTPPERAFLSARCDADPDPILAERLRSIQAPVLLTQGFIARGSGGATVLLGRGGSDTSATLLSARLQAERCEIWTDVPGMFTADPRTVPDARLLRFLDYAEAQEIATTGAKVLHPACIRPARMQGVPIHIRCTPDPELPDTTIAAGAEEATPGVKAVSARRNVTLVSMETIGMWQQVGFLAEATACFARLGLSIDLVATSESNVTVSLDPAANVLGEETLQKLSRQLSAFCEPRVLRGCASVSLVGRGIRSILHRLSGVLELFEEQKVYLLSQAASDLNLTVVVDGAQADRLVDQLHAVLLQEIEGTASLGPSWTELMEGGIEAPAASASGPWWRRRRQDLLSTAAEGTPVYVYDEGCLRAQARALTDLSAVDRVLYAMKANPNPEILRVLAEEGVGFECVSPGEIERARGILDQQKSQAPLLFTPNFAPAQEYSRGFELGARVTLDNLHPLLRWPERFSGREVFLRVDPGRGAGHHAHVRTAGDRSKFGIHPDELPRVAALAREHEVEVVGLHAHVGSGVRDPEAWPRTAQRLAALAEQHFPGVRVLDLGGGLGVPEKPGQAGLDLARLDEALQAFKAAHPRFELWLEPGRYLVAQAGVLLARVTQQKQKGRHRFIGIDAGMHTLIRPALYGAWHEILNLSRDGAEGPFIEADIVGPICETGDVLGHDRRILEPAEGDVLLIGTAGAYGAAMSSEYNLRGRAREVLLREA